MGDSIRTNLRNYHTCTNALLEKKQRPVACCFSIASLLVGVSAFIGLFIRREAKLVGSKVSNSVSFAMG